MMKAVNALVRAAGRALMASVLGLSIVLTGCASSAGSLAQEPVRSADGVEIAFEVAGHGEPTVALIHCGFCNQGVWRHQVSPLSRDYRVVTLDLAGHGRSGADRQVWSIEAFASDVQAVLDAIGAERVVLVGSSLGGAVALAAAESMPGRVEAAIGIDTFQDVARPPVRPEVMRKQLEPLVRDFVGLCPLMVNALLPDDPDSELKSEMQQLMCSMPPERAAAIWEDLYEWRPHDVMSGLDIPVRAINGSKIPTDIEAIQKRVGDFDAVVLEGLAHFPMLESPEVFTAKLLEMLEALEVADP